LASCRRKGQPIGVAAAVIWFFENWLNIARYLSDARAMELPLVGGGDHDWNTILGRWGLLAYDLRIAQIIRFLAASGICIASLWVLWRAWHDRAVKSSIEKSPAGIAGADRELSPARSRSDSIGSVE